MSAAASAGQCDLADRHFLAEDHLEVKKVVRHAWSLVGLGELGRTGRATPQAHLKAQTWSFEVVGLKWLECRLLLEAIRFCFVLVLHPLEIALLLLAVLLNSMPILTAQHMEGSSTRLVFLIRAADSDHGALARAGYFLTCAGSRVCTSSQSRRCDLSEDHDPAEAILP